MRLSIENGKANSSVQARNPRVNGNFSISVAAGYREEIAVTKRRYRQIRANSRDQADDWLNNDVWPTDLAATLNAAPISQFHVWDLDGEDEDPLVGGTIVRFTGGSSPAPIPEPTTILLFGTGLAGAASIRHWRHRTRP